MSTSPDGQLRRRWEENFGEIKGNISKEALRVKLWRDGVEGKWTRHTHSIKNTARSENKVI
jgi:hypothetical protein